MATSTGHRVVAFFLAGLFLLSTLGATAYVIWQINHEEGGIVNETAEEKAAAEALKTQQATEEAQQSEDPNYDPNVCGRGTFAAVEPRTTPTVTTRAGSITELQTVDVKVGDGEEVQPGDCVAALYYGTLATTGESFDGNYDTGAPIEFSLDGVIAGWTEGIPGMKVGGVRRLLIPAEKGYGAQGSGETIPANSDLIFEVEIVSTKRGE
ncbi:MAG: FKBP-type peptidyl-prolyl cis-trans isomerase [Candidatus Zixiibacteriota bacterium]